MSNEKDMLLKEWVTEALVGISKENNRLREEVRRLREAIAWYEEHVPDVPEAYIVATDNCDTALPKDE